MTGQEDARSAHGGSSRRHLLITGTGRAGTSFLVRYLTALGFDTHLSRQGDGAFWDESAQAGLEDIPLAGDPDTLPYVIKSPWLALHPESLGRRVTLDGIIVPVRNLDEAAMSRVVIERQAIDRAAPWMAEADQCWDAWGTVPGGVVYSLEPLDQARILAVGLHRIIEYALMRDIPLALLAFPRVIEDGAYLHARLAPVLGREIDPAKARAVHEQIADTDKVRTGREIERLRSAEQNPHRAQTGRQIQDIARQRGAAGQRAEMERLREEAVRQRAEMQTLREEAARQRAEMEMIRREGATAAARLAAIEASTSWQVTAPLRNLANLITRRQVMKPGPAGTRPALRVRG